MKISGMFRRNEGFRLTFNKPVLAVFTIVEIENEHVDSKEGEAAIIDISLQGAKIISPLVLPVFKTKIQLECTIVNEELKFVGELVWRNKTNNGCTYGVSFDPDTYSKEQLFEALKKYVNKNKSHDN